MSAQEGRWIYCSLGPATLMLLRDWLVQLAFSCQTRAAVCF